MAGRVLVSPDGDRITPERLRGILWREELHVRSTGKTRLGRHSVAPLAKRPAPEHRVGDA